MMPFWLYSLGSTITDDVKFEIPIFHLLLNLMVLVLPSTIGFILGCYVPKLKKIAKILNTLINSLLFTALFIAFLLMSRLYALRFGKAIFILIGTYKNHILLNSLINIITL